MTKNQNCNFLVCRGAARKITDYTPFFKIIF